MIASGPGADAPVPGPGLPLDDAAAALFTVGQVADVLGVQQAFLRRLDSHDVVSPARSDGQQRRYSRHDVHRVQAALVLIDGGLTLPGVRMVLDLRQQVSDLQQQVRELSS